NEVMWGQNIFINKINNIINEKESYMKFIEEFKSKYNQA
ncbi:MAG: CotS family spore coat protein, partial [Clostridium perfringens]|nr:CotS family spore coat protein [Clostridium perfringens]